MTDEKDTPLHYQSSINKVNKDGDVVLSSYLDPGETLASSGASYEDLAGGKDTQAAEDASGGAAFLQPEPQKGDAADPGLTTDETITHTRAKRGNADKIEAKADAKADKDKD